MPLHSLGFSALFQLRAWGLTYESFRLQIKSPFPSKVPDWTAHLGAFEVVRYLGTNVFLHASWWSLNETDRLSHCHGSLS